MEKDQAQLPNSIEAAGAAIADRCASDPDWMAKFKADPRGVLQEAIGRELPSDLQIHLHQNDDDNWHVPIAGAGGRLRDSDLQRIAGGEIVGIASALAVAGVGLGIGVLAGGSTAAGVIVSDKKKSSGKK